MVNYLYWHEVKEAEEMLKVISPVLSMRAARHLVKTVHTNNKPETDLLSISDKVFTLASQHLSQSAILENIQRWIKGSFSFPGRYIG